LRADELATAEARTATNINVTVTDSRSNSCTEDDGAVEHRTWLGEHEEWGQHKSLALSCRALVSVA
jgi:hypothetical protein